MRCNNVVDEGLLFGYKVFLLKWKCWVIFYGKSRFFLFDKWVIIKVLNWDLFGIIVFIDFLW